MHRIARFDIGRSIENPGVRLGAQLVFGAACSVTMIVTRTALDMVAPSLGVFALVYPTVLLATLFGRWQAGVIAFLLSFLWAWYFVLPFPGSFRFGDAGDTARVIIHALSALVVLFFAEAFRRAVREYADANEKEIARRRLLMAELEHRTKNNFALVASLLEIQKRRQPVPGIEKPLNDAIGRVRTFADAYSNLASEQDEGAEVSIKPYLEQLIERVHRAAFSDEVTIRCEIEPMQLRRETGVAIGLFVNEALSNCAKYAFPDGTAGEVVVRLEGRAADWVLDVSDNGLGKLAESDTKGGLGRSLMAAFAKQASADYRIDFRKSGCRARLASKGEASH